MIADKLQQYIDNNKMYNFESYTGLRRLEKLIIDVCGHSDMYEFLADNPGAMNALVEWIGDQRVSEWSSNLDAMGCTGEEE